MQHLLAKGLATHKLISFDAMHPSMAKLPRAEDASLAFAEVTTAIGLLYAFQGQMRLDEITGGSPYGASTIAGGKGERMASENELAAARFQGRHVAQIAQRLFR